MEDFGNEKKPVMKIINNKKILTPDNLIKTKESPFTNFLPSWLEEALDRYFKFNDVEALREAKRRAIQEAINGALFNSTVFKALGLSEEDYYKIMKQREKLIRSARSSEVDFCQVVRDLEQFFTHCSLEALLPNSKITVYSLGCGLGQEATALINFFKERLAGYWGYDKYEDLIRRASDLNLKDERLHFERKDLTQNLPPKKPNLVIVRNPNVFLWEEEGQREVNQDWEEILKKTKNNYSGSVLLVTTITSEEADLVQSWIGGEVKKNLFATPIEADFKGYGRFQLPVGVDQYYILR